MKFACLPAFWQVLGDLSDSYDTDSDCDKEHMVFFLSAL